MNIFYKKISQLIKKYHHPGFILVDKAPDNCMTLSGGYTKVIKPPVSK